MSHYKHHVFFCCNQRDTGERVLQRTTAPHAMRDYAQGPRQGR